MQPKTEKITPKINLFIENYLIHFNGQQAAIDAGFNPKSAKQSAYRMKNEPFIKKEIQSRMNERLLSVGVDKQYIINELVEIIISSKEEDKTDRASILKALDMLAKIGGFYSDTTVNLQNNVNSITVEIIRPDDK